MKPPPVAVITGASRGLGRHTALCFAEAGYRVAICGRTEEDLEEVVRDITDVGGVAIASVVDVRDNAAVEAFVTRSLDELGPIDVLINNAGLMGRYDDFAEWTVEEIDLTVDVNLKGTLYATRAALPSMLEQRCGHIINIASDIGRRAIPKMAPYVAAKHAVVGFSGSLLREVRGRGLKVTVVLPGIIDTYFGGNEEGDRDENWALRPEHLAQTILQIARQPANLVMDEVQIHPLGQDF